MANKKLHPKSDDQASGVENQHRTWNVLIYMAADNNLKEESIFTLTEIMKACIDSPLKVIVQLDSGSSVRRYDFTGLTAAKGQRDLLDLGKPPIAPGSPGAKMLSGAEVLSDAEMLKKFLLTNMDKNAWNLVVLNGHGEGAVGDFLPSEDPPRALSIPSLKTVLAHVKRQVGEIHVLGMDSCLMSMAEVCYELKDEVNFLVGAEGFARNTGWPYAEILQFLRQDPPPTPAEVARHIVAEYIRYYSAYTISGVSVDQAACDLKQANKLKDEIEALVNKLTTQVGGKPAKIEQREIQNALILAHWRAQSYKFEQYVDLWDFCELLQMDCADVEIKKACRRVQTAIETLVLDSRHSGAEFQHSHGLSVYFPWAKSDLDRTLCHYENLAFDQASGWGRNFLSAYGEKTQREHRRDPNNLDAETVLAPPSLGYEIGLGVAPSVRTSFVDGSRASFVDGTVATAMESPRGGRIIIPLVKNPPGKFVKFDNRQSSKKAKKQNEKTPEKTKRNTKLKK
jgi:hypothetical protein